MIKEALYRIHGWDVAIGLQTQDKLVYLGTEKVVDGVRQKDCFYLEPVDDR